MNEARWSAGTIPSRAAIAERLRATFPEGMEDRNFLIRDIAAAT